ncbi:MAG: NAD-dependent epimerase/dehydratase family protein [Gammaproteobacteria bacterium]|nr:NAD-dependent epimerase/dehydratase family protein [Gammaproteobacteria bacterium]
MSDARRILVTGASGLVGAWVTKALCAQPERFRVRVLVRSRDKLARALAPLGMSPETLDVAEGDITDSAAVARAVVHCDAVVHCAGLYSADVTELALLRKTNVTGTQIVLDAARAAGADPVVHVSSYLAMFPPRGAVQRADDPVTEPSSAYAKTKAEAERIARRHQDDGAAVVIVYPGAIHGPHDPTFSATPAYLADAIRSNALLVNEGGRPYIDVRDVAELIVKSLEPGLGPRRFMLGGPFVPDGQFHALLCELLQHPVTAKRVPGWLLRAIGRIGDMRRVLTGREPQLTYEAACVITRSVPCDDAAAIALLGRPLTDIRTLLHDLLLWMYQAGHLDAAQAGPALVAEARELETNRS